MRRPSHPTHPAALAAVLAVLLLSLASPAQAVRPLGLVLPTDNDAIFSDDPSQFYMYTDRHFEGVSSKPWSGGTYGFSRNQKRTTLGIVFTRFHAGIDIRPVRRDSSGSPLDEVRSIAEGTVVYVNDSATASSYGRYIVVHHDWGYGPFFSLYAHLGPTSAEAGQRVAAGQTIARMGYTGRGINRERAHLHLELNMLLSDRYQRWHERHFTAPNHHGIYNGFNMTSIDIAALYKAHRANPSITLPEFIASHHEIHYRVAVPARDDLPFLRRYPWMARGFEQGRRPASWEFAFDRAGIPVEVRPSDQRISSPAVTWVKPSTVNHADFTSGRITGTGDKATVTHSGSRYLQLISDSF